MAYAVQCPGQKPAGTGPSCSGDKEFCGEIKFNHRYNISDW